MAKKNNLIVYTVTGRITNIQNVPVEGLIIRTFCINEKKQSNPIGKEVLTNSDGQYTIGFAENVLFPQGLENTVSAIFIRAYDKDRLLAESKTILNPKNKTTINLKVDFEKRPLNDSMIRRVYGILRNKYGELLNGATVQAFDCDLRGEQLLGTANTAEGFYEIQYNQTQFRKTYKEKAVLVLKVFDTTGKELHKTPLQYNVPDEVEININLGGSEYKGLSEFEALTEVLTPLLEGMSPLDLREDDQYHDITFLSGETGRSSLAIGTWVISQRLSAKASQEKTPLEASIIFSFLRQGQPGIFYDSLMQDIKYPERVALLEEKLMRKLVSIKPDMQKTLVEKAVTENLIPARVKATWDETQGMLRKINLRFSGEKIFGAGKGTVGQLIELTRTPIKQQEAFKLAFADHDGSINDFWKKLEEDKVFTAKSIEEVKLIFGLGGLTRNHIPLVNELNAMFKKGDLKAKRDLAKLSREEWKEIFKRPQSDGKPIDVPINIDGKDEEEKMEQYAVILEQRFERKYPTTAFSANLSRSEQSPISCKSDIVRFLENNPQFYLDLFRIDHYLAENKDALKGVQDSEKMLMELKAAQRIFKHNSTYKVVDTLLSNKIDSAQKIYFMGASQFVSEMSKAGINKIEAKSLFAKSEMAYAMALNLFSTFNCSMNGAMPTALPRNRPDAETQIKIQQIPNLQTLFGSMDYCECSDCRSVYSPSAYFVDIMRFLGNREINGTKRSAKDVLLERRPDLGEIEMSCENTNTVLPYIDLVNEILEEVVGEFPEIILNFEKEKLKPGKIDGEVLMELKSRLTLNEDAIVYPPYESGQSLIWIIRDSNHAYKLSEDGEDFHFRGPAHQTFMNSSELRANTEYTNDYAYMRLEEEVFPLNLPFDLWSFQTRNYLNHLGISHPRLLELFQQKNGINEYYADLAWLRITEKEGKILYAPDKGVWEYWGLKQNNNLIPDPADPTREFSGTWVELLCRVNVLLHRSELTYRNLLQVIDTKYVNPAGGLYIRQDTPDPADPDTEESLALSCDTSCFFIAHIDPNELPTAFYRMNRFIRLWRKLGCEIWELDMLLPINNPDHQLKEISLGALVWISQMNRLREEINLDWNIVYSLYNNIDHNIYYDRSKEGAPQVQTLYQRLFKNKLIDSGNNFPDDPNTLNDILINNIPFILAAFQINEADLNLIASDLCPGLKTKYPELNCNNPIVKFPLNWNTLSQIYRNTVLAKSLGISIESFLHLKRLWTEDPFSSPSSTLKFVQLAHKVTGSGFSILELDYLLSNKYSVNSGVALDEKSLAGIIKNLREGLQQINDSLIKKPEESSEAYIKSKLGKLPTLRKDTDQVKALAIINNTIKEEREGLIGTYFSVMFSDIGTAKKKLDTTSVDMVERLDFVKDELEAYLLKTQKEDFIKQKIAETLQIDTPTANELLNGLVVSDKLLINHINDDNLLEKENDKYKYEINDPIFSNIYTVLHLLHKNAFLIGKLKINPVELKWLLGDTNHIKELNWPDLQLLPVNEGDAPIPIIKWECINDFYKWKESLPKSDLTAIEFLDHTFDPGKTDGNIKEALARLTAWELSDIGKLTDNFGWEVKKELKKSEHLIRMSECMQVLKRLGVKAERALSWAKIKPTLLDAESLKQTIKAKYDLKQWLEIIQPMQDVFREQKREALVSWLVTHPDKTKGQYWTDVNGLYSYFLIDVEMSPCMLTSRIKQATASVQLFVQRCMIHLEPEVIVDSEADSDWKQWNWMKNYRVWEANRKVFLYPENWIEPELRDDKSPFFKELENELMQSDINRDTVEQAYLNYLEKLDKVANLEIRAMHNEVISTDESILHVFGRTRSSKSPEYFYRKHINRARWTPWERIDLEINSDHLVPTVHNRRLYLFWPQFLEKADEPTSVAIPKVDTPAKIETPKRYWEIRLFRSELKNSKWSPKILTDVYSKIYHDSVTGNNPQNISIRSILKPSFDHWLMLYKSSNTALYAPKTDSSFEILGNQINYSKIKKKAFLIAPLDSRYFGNLIQHNNGAPLYFYFSKIIDSRNCLVNNNYNYVSKDIIILFEETFKNTFTVIDSTAEAFTDEGMFFTWDDCRTYFVTYLYNSSSKSFRFYIHYHPFVDLFTKELQKKGIKGLLNRNIQANPEVIQGIGTTFDFEKYNPTNLVPKEDPNDNKTIIHPIESVDFNYESAYSLYNWELFFHLPFLVANKLSSNQRFEEALEWFHYVFDPTITDTYDPISGDLIVPPQKYWITKPFYETIDYIKQKIEEILLIIAGGGETNIIKAIAEWRDNPFKPHLIARTRTVAYQKNVLIKYIQTLIAWGDQLFRHDTIETLNEATQLYILAASILGPRPKSIPRKVDIPIKSFYQLNDEGVDPFGNVLEQIENILPSVTVPGSAGDYDPYSTNPSLSNPGNTKPPLPNLNVLYFCIPHNEKLLTLWDSVADRLFKIRHCMNIEGVVRQLPLYEPPIDPALLVKAAAAGLDIGSVISDMNASMPLYRFNFMIQRALELCNEVRSLGNAFLSALEKKDAEAFALLRSNNEISMLDYIRILKDKQIKETLTAKESLEKLKLMVEERMQYYRNQSFLPVLLSKEDGSSVTIPCIPLNTREQISLYLSNMSLGLDATIALGYMASGGLKLVPSFVAGAAGFGGSPTVSASTGGNTFGNSAEDAVRTLQSIATAFDKGASIASTIASYQRRFEEWDFQKRLADREIPQVQKQIDAADIRHQIAQQELVNHDKQKENLQKEDEYMRSKFTNQELYDWMLNQLSTVYFQSYQLAYDIAKRAERCFRYELGLSDSNYIQFGYWDSLKKGLLSGEKLFYDLKRLETAYYEQNRREYELTKHISLAQNDPVSLLFLRQNGECIVNIPEIIFDMDYPGHYFRRIKSVSLTIPCVAGPYTTVACTLTLMSNSLRKDTGGTPYGRILENEDPRFRDEIAAIQSIATSNALNDSGLFEFNFRDERYLPFEGAGAISTWQIKLNKDFKQFDFNSISDVIIHMNYTAREMGDILKPKVVSYFNKKLNDMALAEDTKGLFRVYDLKHEFSKNWIKFLHPGIPDMVQELVLENLDEKLPYFTRNFPAKKATGIEVVALIKKPADSTDNLKYQVELSTLKSDSNLPYTQFDDQPLQMSLDGVYQGLFHVSKPFDKGNLVNLCSWTIKIRMDGINDYKSLPEDAIEELFLVVNYTIQ